MCCILLPVCCTILCLKPEGSGDLVVVVNASDQRISCCVLHTNESQSGLLDMNYYSCGLLLFLSVHVIWTQQELWSSLSAFWWKQVKFHTRNTISCCKWLQMATLQNNSNVLPVTFPVPESHHHVPLVLREHSVGLGCSITLHKDL